MEPLVSPEDQSRTQAAKLANERRTQNGRIEKGFGIGEQRHASAPLPVVPFSGNVDRGVEIIYETKGGGAGGLPLYVLYTFFVTPGANGSGKVNVTAGAIGSAIYTGSGAGLAVSDGNKIWINTTVNGFGAATAVSVAAGATIPANTTTHGYTPLALVSISGGVISVTLLAYNYSQVQLCGQAGTSTTYLWGGFGS